MTSQNSSQKTLSILSIFVCIILAGITATVLSLLISLFNWSEVYSSFISVIVSVPVGMLGMFSWQKGFKNLDRNDFIISIMGGVGASIGLLIVQMLK